MIELSDLRAFEVDGFINAAPVIVVRPGMGSLSFFTYNTQSAASSLGLIATLNGITGCLGAPSVLALACNPNGDNPASTVGAFNLGNVLVTTPDQPIVTLVSSVTIPELSTWAMMVLGLVGLGFMGAQAKAPTFTESKSAVRRIEGAIY